MKNITKNKHKISAKLLSIMSTLCLMLSFVSFFAFTPTKVSAANVAPNTINVTSNLDHYKNGPKYAYGLGRCPTCDTSGQVWIPATHSTTHTYYYNCGSDAQHCTLGINCAALRNESSYHNDSTSLYEGVASKDTLHPHTGTYKTGSDVAGHWATCSTCGGSGTLNLSMGVLFNYVDGKNVTQIDGAAYCTDFTKKGPGEAGYNMTKADCPDYAMLKAIMYYGYPNKSEYALGAVSADTAYMATQFCIWRARGSLGSTWNGATSINNSRVIETANQIWANASANINNIPDNRQMTIDESSVEVTHDSNYFYVGPYFTKVGGEYTSNYTLSAKSGCPDGTTFVRDAGGWDFKIPINNFNGTASIAATVSTTEAGGFDVAYYSPPSSSQQGMLVASKKSISPVSVEHIFDEDKGNLTITKKGDDGKLLEGVVFELTNVATGTKYTLRTDANGIAKTEDQTDEGSIPYGKYNLHEKSGVLGYAVSNDGTVVIDDNNTEATVTVTNTEQFGSLKVTKTAEDHLAEDDNRVSLAGFKFKLEGTSLNGKTVTEYATTNEQGIATFSKVQITNVTGYKLSEVETPDRYITPTIGENTQIEWNKETNVTVNNVLKKGKVQIFKQMGTADGSGVQTPEANAVFEVYNSEFYDSYANAPTLWKDEITTDENGMAVTKDLPLGLYTVHQVGSASDNYEYVKDFQVRIAQEGQTYFYPLVNPLAKRAVKIIKKDIETGKTIAVAGTGFKVKNLDTDKYVTLKILYPEPIEIDEFYTTEKGELTLPEDLLAGNYQLEEIQAPNGYTLLDEPVQFKVDRNSDVTVVVEAKNLAQKGTITITKQGEALSTIKNADDLYTMQYASRGLQGAEYKVYANEDITTLDGAVRAVKGDLVATLTTAEDGTIKTPLLYLGQYRVVETKAPLGYVLGTDTEQIVTLTYAGQTVKITNADSLYTNDRQKFILDLRKALEQDTTYKIGMNDEYLNVRFGLYANEEIKAADGTTIPKDGLIEVCGIDKDGKVLFNSDLVAGKYYVKEIATDEHYMFEGDTKYEFECKYTDDDSQQTITVVIATDPILNTLKRGNVDGLKYSENAQVLAGAKFGIFSKIETEFNSSTAYLTAVSDDNGVFKFTDVPYGEYVVREIEAPLDYKLSLESIEVNVSEDKAVVAIECVNYLLKHSITSEVEGGNGTITPGTDNIEINRDEWEFTITPDEGYEIEKVTLDGKEVTGEVVNGKWTFHDVCTGADAQIEINHHVIVRFKTIPTPAPETSTNTPPFMNVVYAALTIITSISSFVLLFKRKRYAKVK